MPRVPKNQPLYSDAPVLFWTGPADPHTPGSKVVPGVPARDLTEHDLARVIYQQTVTMEDGPLTEGSEFESKRADLLGFLLSIDLYSKDAPPEEARPDEPGKGEGA